MTMSPSLRKSIDAMDRKKIVQVLEGYGFACYASESTRSLRSALKVNVEDGTIDSSVVDDDGAGMAPSRPKYR